MLRFLKKKKKKKEEIHFQTNGSLLLEELISSSGGQYNPIHTFSSHQILQATNNFDWKNLISEDRVLWFKGMIENKCVLIKKFQDWCFFDEDNVYRDIAISSMMSSHKNVLKLLGCCLELPVYVANMLERGLLTELIDPSMLASRSDNIPEHSRLQMEAFIELAFRCVSFGPGENVSHMIDIARELKKI